MEFQPTKSHYFMGFYHKTLNSANQITVFSCVYSTLTFWRPKIHSTQYTYRSGCIVYRSEICVLQFWSVGLACIYLEKCLSTIKFLIISEKKFFISDNFEDGRLSKDNLQPTSPPTHQATSLPLLHKSFFSISPGLLATWTVKIEVKNGLLAGLQRGERGKRRGKKKKRRKERGDAVEMVPSIQNYVTYLMSNMMFVHVAPIEV